MKMKNQKGFVLMETLVVAVFVVGIFSFLFVNVIPLTGEYEIRNTYDTIDAKYAAHWVRKMVLDFGTPSLKATTTYKDITACSSTDFLFVPYCNLLKDELKISSMYVVPYSLMDFKTTVQTQDAFASNRALQEYVKYLPTYSKATSKNGELRVIVEIDAGNGRREFGTIEVIKSA